MKGKQILMLGLAALVITAGYYRWTVETDQNASLPVAGESIPVEENEAPVREAEKGQSLSRLKQERDRSRGEMMEQWKKTTEDQESSGAEKQAAEDKRKKAEEAMEKERTIENLICAKGYEDCYVRISESGVTVRVAGGEMNGSKVAQMKDIIVGETGVEVKKIKISAEEPQTEKPEKE